MFVVGFIVGTIITIVVFRGGLQILKGCQERKLVDSPGERRFTKH
jgi:hypothetical protein